MEKCHPLKILEKFRKMSTIASNSSLNIKTFVFFDMEATGLPQLDGNRTKITEISFVAVQSNHLRLGVFPRVQNKLNFCFNPWKRVADEAEKMTGLSNFLLEEQSRFCKKTVETINGFLEHNSQPICFVAHNGNMFDFPILRAEVLNTGIDLLENIYCVDSLEAFRSIENKSEDTVDSTQTKGENSNSNIPLELQDNFDKILFDAVEREMETITKDSCRIENNTEDIEIVCTGEALNKVKLVQNINETTPRKRSIGFDASNDESDGICVKRPKEDNVKKRLNYNLSYKLPDVYKRLTSKQPKICHQAEGDVILMLTCAATLGDKFVDWANRHARNFNDIKPMTPGRKIGT